VVKREERIDCEAYRRRNAVKRCVNRLQQWRGRHALREAAANYRAMIIIATLMIRLGT
jgi:transposase